MKGSARVIVTDMCNRNCWYCANEKDHKCTEVSVEELDVYGTLVLTGGEPMLVPNRVLEILKRHEHKKNYMYTQHYHWKIHEILEYLDGITFTMHDTSARSLDNLGAIECALMMHKKLKGFNLNARLNIMPGVSLETSSIWDTVKHLEISEDCPVPEDVLVRLKDE